MTRFWCSSQSDRKAQIRRDKTPSEWSLRGFADAKLSEKSSRCTDVSALRPSEFVDFAGLFLRLASRATSIFAKRRKSPFFAGTRKCFDFLSEFGRMKSGTTLLSRQFRYFEIYWLGRPESVGYCSLLGDRRKHQHNVNVAFFFQILYKFSFSKRDVSRK